MGMCLSPTRRRSAAAAAVAVALSALAAAATVPTVTTAAGAVKPTLLRPLPDLVKLSWGGTLTLVAAAAGTAPISYRWEQQTVRNGPFVPVPAGDAVGATYSAPFRCPAPFGDDELLSVRVVLTNGEGTFASRGTNVFRYFPRLTFTRTAPAEVAAAAAGAPGRTISWTIKTAVTRPPVPISVYLERDGPNSGGFGVRVRRTSSPGVVRATYTFANNGWDDGQTVRARAFAACRHQSVVFDSVANSSTTRLAPPAGVVTPALCPPPLRARPQDRYGVPLNDGRVSRRPTCAACAATCAAMPGCSVWVWGATGERRGECWAKGVVRVAGGGARPTLPPTPSSLWVSGVTDVYRPHVPFVIGRDLGGEVLNDGAAALVLAVLDCSALCRRTPRCNAWVYGIKAVHSDRHRQCWVKRIPDVWNPPVKAWDERWASGVDMSEVAT